MKIKFFLQWHALGRDEQAKYYELARRERQLHMQMYPEWNSRNNVQLQQHRSGNSNSVFTENCCNLNNCKSKKRKRGKQTHQRHQQYASSHGNNFNEGLLNKGSHMLYIYV